jgi:hypothetical protein
MSHDLKNADKNQEDLDFYGIRTILTARASPPGPTQTYAFILSLEGGPFMSEIFSFLLQPGMSQTSL